MKKIYSLVCASFLVLHSFNVNSATIVVNVGQAFGGAASNSFNPQFISPQIGDVVAFTWFSGTHNVVSTTVPSGAAAINSGTMSSTSVYNYTVTLAGDYWFECSIHGSSMFGNLSVATGIAEPSVNLLTTVYPNPFKDKLTLKYNAIESVEFYNIVGEKIKTVELSSIENKKEIDLADLKAGIYFISTRKEGIVVETKKIIKSK